MTLDNKQDTSDKPVTDEVAVKKAHNPKRLKILTPILAIVSLAVMAAYDYTENNVEKFEDDMSLSNKKCDQTKLMCAEEIQYSQQFR